jgi:phosphocarrier protein FPr
VDASVELSNLTNGAGPVAARSLSRVATLGALEGHEVEVRATGPQAQRAVDELIALARRSFDEPTTEKSGTSPQPAVTSGPGPLPASPGIAIGPVRRLTVIADDSGAAEDAGQPDDPAAQWDRIVEAVARVHANVERVRDTTAREVGVDEAAIFETHLALLTDADILTDVRTRIDAGADAAAAWTSGLADVEQEWAQLPHSYLRERAGDVSAVAQQVRDILIGTTGRQPSGDGILVAPDLTPAEAAGLDTARVTGVVLAFGSATSHAAILARARGIPMVVAAGAATLSVAENTVVVLDGASGQLHIDPAADVLEVFRQRAGEQAERRKQHLVSAQQPAVTRDGARLEVGANLGSVADAGAAVAAGADVAGLVRTEFMFLERSAAPDLAEQEAQYGAIAHAMDGRRITLRTLDVGGDKALPYLDLPAERNPFLGLRGTRLSLYQRELLHRQLVAVCRTATHHPTSVMFPMVSTLDELLDARQILLAAAGPGGLPAGLRVGIMVEVPAAALKIESFLPHVDFVSIGTNDLTQYTLAAERGNATVAQLADALDPGVLQLVARVCRAAEGHVDVAVCGEAASDEHAIALFVGLGVRELSVAPQAVPAVKAIVRGLDSERCRNMAEQALTLAGATDVRRLVLATPAGAG